MTSPKDIMRAKLWLDSAIDRHQRHMDGEEPADEPSQMVMMVEMKKARAALDGKDAPGMNE